MLSTSRALAMLPGLTLYAILAVGYFLQDVLRAPFLYSAAPVLVVVVALIARRGEPFFDKCSELLAYVTTIILVALYIPLYTSIAGLEWLAPVLQIALLWTTLQQWHPFAKTLNKFTLLLLPILFLLPPGWILLFFITFPWL